METTFFGYFGHGWLLIHRIIVSTCGRHQSSSALPKINFISHFLIKILHFKKILPFDWLTVFWPRIGEPEFFQIQDWW